MNSAVEALEAMLTVVIERAREDAEFAKALTDALAKGLEKSDALQGENLPDAPPSHPVIATSAKADAPCGAAARVARSAAKVSTGSRNRRAAKKQNSEKAARRRSTGAFSASSDLSALDLSTLMAQLGRRGAQDALLEGPFTAAQLRAYAAARGLSLRGAGRRRRDLVDALIAGASTPRADAFA